MDITSQLGSFAANLKHADIPAQVRERCRICVLDAIGVMIGGADFARREGDHCLENYLKATAPPGDATVFGYGLKTTPLMAAFANGTTSEVLDYQDSHWGSLAHSGTPTIPAALALAETRNLTWGALVPAIVAGYEVHIRLLAAIQPGHWYKGFQGTGTFGTSGAATTAGHLLGFNAGQMSAALGISGFVMPVSNGDQQFKGYSVKPVHGGQAAMCGLSSAYMAQAGYLAGPLEGEPPRHHAALQILSDGGPNEERALAGFKDTWEIMDVAFKPYPVGHLNVGPVELIHDMLAERPIQPDDVKSIEITTHLHGVTFTGRRYTTVDSNFVSAHMSMPYCVAAALTDGELTPRQLSKERLRDPKLHELASRVTVSEDPAMTAALPDAWPVEIIVRMKNGTAIKRRVDKVKWSPHRIPTWAELSAKFHLMADPVLGAEHASNAIGILADLKEGDSLKSLMANLQNK